MVAHIQLYLTSGKRAEENHDKAKRTPSHDGYRVVRSMHTGSEITGRGGVTIHLNNVR